MGNRLKDILSRKKHLEEQVLELVALCRIDIDNSTDLQEKIRNHVQDILQIEVKLLDNLAYCIFKKYYPDKEGDVSFPYKGDGESLLKHKLVSKYRTVVFGMEELKEKNINIYKIIEKHQPYQNDGWWNKYVHEYANVAHIGLVPQQKQTVVATPLGNFSIHSNVRIKDAHIMNVGGGKFSMDNFTISKGKVTGFDPKTMEYQTRYLHESSDVDMIELCVISNNKIQEIILELEPLL